MFVLYNIQSIHSYYISSCGSHSEPEPCTAYQSWMHYIPAMTILLLLRGGSKSFKMGGGGGSQRIISTQYTSERETRSPLRGLKRLGFRARLRALKHSRSMGGGGLPTIVCFNIVLSIHLESCRYMLPTSMSYSRLTDKSSEVPTKMWKEIKGIV